VRIPGEPTEVPHGMVESQTHTQAQAQTQTHILDTHTARGKGEQTWYSVETPSWPRNLLITSGLDSSGNHTTILLQMDE
jgi:hypothetical protein